MQNLAGIIKQISGNVIVIDANGNQRVLNVGDKIAIGDKVVTLTPDSKVIIATMNGKEVAILGNDELVLDQSLIDSGSNSNVLADISGLQKAILEGQGVENLEATAAGGGTGSNSLDGTSLSSTNFTDSGSISNVFEGFGDLNNTTQPQFQASSSLGSTVANNTAEQSNPLIEQQNSTESNSSTEDTKPNDSNEPNNPTQPEPNEPNPIEPAEPNNPTQPEPNEPTQPSYPSEPNQPNNPTEPTEPSEPNNPSEPSEPNTPNQPDPSEPNNPSEPSNPSNPNEPNEPQPVTQIEIPSSAYIREMSVYNDDKVTTDNKPNIEGATLADSSTAEIGGRKTNYFEALNSEFDADKSSSIANDGKFDLSDYSTLSPWFTKTLPENFEIEVKTAVKGEGKVEFEKAYLKVPEGQEFTKEDGWYTNSNKTLIIGSDNAKGLVITNEAGKDNPDYEGKRVIVLENGATPPRIFGGDNSDDVTIDGVDVEFVSTGTGDDIVALKNGAKVLTDINTGDGNDLVTVEGKNTSVEGSIFTGAGDDDINIVDSKVKGSINSGAGDDEIKVDSGTVEKNIYGRDGDDNITLDNKAIVGGNIEAGKGAGEINILEGSKVNKKIRSGIEEEFNAQGDTPINHDFAGNVDVRVDGGSLVVGSIDLNGTGFRNITIDNNSTVGGNIHAGEYSDSKVVVQNNSKVNFTILGEGGNDTIIVKDSEIGKSAGEFSILSDVERPREGYDGNDTIEITNSKIHKNIDAGGGDDKITISGGSVDAIYGNEGNDNITVNDGANISNTIEGNDGNDTISIAGTGTIVNQIHGNSGDDYIQISDGAKILREVNSGNSTDLNLDTPNLGSTTNKAAHDKIVIENAMVGDKDSGGNTTTTGYVYTNGAAEVIIKNSTVTGDIEAKNPIYEQNIKVSEASVVEGSVKGADGAKDTVTVENSEIKGSIDTRGGDDVINTNKAAIGGEVQGGAGQDNITVSGGSAQKVRGGDDNDQILVNDGAKIANIVVGDKGDDIIRVTGEDTQSNIVCGGADSDHVTVSNGANVINRVNTGGGTNDKIFVQDAKTLIGTLDQDGKAVNPDLGNIISQGGSNSIEVSKGATVVGNIWAKGATGEQTIDVKSNSNIMGNIFGSSTAKDNVTIDNAVLNKDIRTYGGDDNIAIQNESFIAGSIATGEGDDKITITSENTTIKSYVSSQEGNDTILVSDKATIGTTVHAGSGDDTVTIKDESSATNVVGSDGADIISILSGAKITNWLLGDTKTHDNSTAALEPNAGADTIIVSGKGTYVDKIGTGEGDDIVLVEQGAGSKIIQADGGSDDIKVTDKDTYVQVINGRHGDDNITVEKQAKVDTIVGRWGNDTITVTGQGTTVTNRVEGNENNDTIKILDGANIGSTVTGGAGEGGYEDNDNILIENSTIKGNVEGGGWAGNDNIKVSNSIVEGKIAGSVGSNDSNTLEQNITVSDGSIIKGDITGTDNGKENIVIQGNGTIVEGSIKTYGQDDSITVKDGAKISSAINSGEGNDVIIVQGTGSILENGVAAYGGNDIIKASDGAKIMGNIHGGAGDDIISLIGENTSASAIFGAEGNDIIVKDSKASSNSTSGDNIIISNDGNLIINDIESSKSIDLSNISKATNDIKSIDLSKVNGATLNISAQDVLDINKTTGETLNITGGSDDTVSDKSSSTWTSKDNGSSDQYSTELNGETVIINIDKNISTDL
ncbi:retention module-containing protein [Campylobacter sp. RM16188]|uniref:retention module-containing protein n=1 Tax=Campylobacter sp. RM16188 TaxID=1705725 RepID=UPI001551DAE3|nr:retention module-containing protein [Campylobacter sp. RM16188]